MQETTKLQTEVINPVIKQSSAIVVTNATQYSESADFLKEIKGAQKQVMGFFKEIKAKTYAAWKEVTTKETDLLKPLKDAEGTIKGKLLVYQQGQDKIRRAQEAKLQAQADERARKEQERLLKRADSLKTPELKEQALEEAEAVVAPIVSIGSDVPQEKGISTRKTWKAQIISKSLFLRSASTDPNLAAFVTIDQGKLDKLAAATKGELSYPGIKFYEHTTMAAR